MLEQTCNNLVQGKHTIFDLHVRSERFRFLLEVSNYMTVIKTLLTLKATSDLELLLLLPQFPHVVLLLGQHTLSQLSALAYHEG